MELTNIAIQAAKPRQKAYKLYDEKGLFLLITPTGAQLWRFKYMFGGREKLLAVGRYPDTSLALARKNRDAARALLAEGIDPNAKRKADRLDLANTFEDVAREWLTNQTALAPSTLHQRKQWIEDYLLPYLGKMPIQSIDYPTVLETIRLIEARGKIDTAQRVRTVAGRIFRYAMANRRCKVDPTVGLSEALKTRTVKNRAAITEPIRVGQLLRDIQHYRGQPATEAALKLAALLFVRPGELRHAEWSEFDLDGADPEWRIPAAKMKMDEQHIVPLAPQSIAILRALRPITGTGKYVFPSVRGPDRPLSENTVLLALRTMGYDGATMSGHGFRTVASTLLNEQGFAADVIELQLAHSPRNKVRAAYNRAQRLPERRKMMVWWADHLDELRARASVKK